MRFLASIVTALALVVGQTDAHGHGFVFHGFGVSAFSFGFPVVTVAPQVFFTPAFVQPAFVQTALVQQTVATQAAVVAQAAPVVVQSAPVVLAASPVIAFATPVFVRERAFIHGGFHVAAVGGFRHVHRTVVRTRTVARIPREQ